LRWGAGAGVVVVLSGVSVGGAHEIVTQVPEIVVDSGEHADVAPNTAGGGELQAASEMVISGKEVQALPTSRPGEALEVVPGLIVTQHSGEGKANQYFLRGYNLDHGTDLSITVDGMPVNMRTHGHGQGYADINFLIPELIRSVGVRKGPYYADEGDFSSAGAVHINYYRSLEKNLALGTIGSFGYGRALGIGSQKVGNGNLLAATEATAYKGPWDVPDDVRKLNGVVRYTEGSRDNGFSITGMAYHNRWTSTDQVAQRAIDYGIIGRFGTLNPTDGGKSSRYSLSGEWGHADEKGETKVNAYVINSSMTLFNDFTYFLNNEVDGDQFSQSDRRTLFGVNASHAFNYRWGGLETQTRIGVQTRVDDIRLGLTNTVQRAFLSNVRQDSVNEQSLGIWFDHNTHWAPWLQTTVGARQDWFAGRVTSDTPENSGRANAGITSPKFGIVLGPWYKTELFGNAGFGFHSNDLRGSTITVEPVTLVPVDRTPLLVRTKGAEVGARTKIIDGLTSAVAVFVLDQDSELLFVGDAGTTEASRPSRRTGVEWTNDYRVNPWLRLDLDLAYTRARFTNDDPAGNHIPGAPAWVTSATAIFGAETGWFGSATLRYFGPRPLIEDASVYSQSSLIVNARAGYHFESGLSIYIDAFNLFDVHTNQIEYYYDSRLATEPPGVATADRHIHPVEPLAVRLTVAGRF